MKKCYVCGEPAELELVATNYRRPLCAECFTAHKNALAKIGVSCGCEKIPPRNGNSDGGKEK